MRWIGSVQIRSSKRDRQCWIISSERFHCLQVLTGDQYNSKKHTSSVSGSRWLYESTLLSIPDFRPPSWTGRGSACTYQYRGALSGSMWMPSYGRPPDRRGRRSTPTTEYPEPGQQRLRSHYSCHKLRMLRSACPT
jgi:hypothetical protein